MIPKCNIKSKRINNNYKYEKPFISVITVVLNSKNELLKTIESVIKQTYDKYEFIIIDGCSTDGTRNIIKEYKKSIDYWLSEKDKGIYDAMNKGIACANGDWLIYLNAGDVFTEKEILEYASRYLDNNVDLLYSDTCFRGRRERIFNCDSSKLKVIHQSIIYRKKLHKEYGKYIVSNGLIVADYIFFNQVYSRQWKKCDRIISLCDDMGVSSKKEMFYQKMGVDLFFGRRGRIYTAIILMFYPIYKILKIIFINLFRINIRNRIS